MTKGAKIALAIGIPVTLFGVYWFGVRNRRPKLSFESIDWLGKRGNVRFGSTENSFSLNKKFGATAGRTFSDRYTMTAEPKDGKQVIFMVYDKGNPIEKTIVDFSAKLKYNEPV